jgi:ribosomal-protein-alanine N-acetyltransferase
MRSPEPKIRDISMPVNPVGIEAHAAEPTISLRPIEAADREWFLAALGRTRADIARWLPLNRPGETDEAYFERQRLLCAEGDRSQKSFRRIGVLDGGTPAGFFALNSISRGLSWEADAIWWVDAAHQGRGVATAGVRALLRHAFGDLPGGLGLHGVHCGIEAGNDASVRVAEKCGFVHDPAKRSHLQVGDRWAMHEFYLATPERFRMSLEGPA